MRQVYSKKTSYTIKINKEIADKIEKFKKDMMSDTAQGGVAK